MTEDEQFWICVAPNTAEQCRRRLEIANLRNRVIAGTIRDAFVGPLIALAARRARKDKPNE